MKTGWQQIVLYLIVLTSYGCLSNEDKYIRQLVQETGICLPNASDSCFLIIIPGNGCGSCIQGDGPYQGSNRHCVCLYV